MIFYFFLWCCNYNIVASWILNSVSKEIQASTLYSAHAFEIWNDFHMHFHQNNGPKVFQLKKDLLNCNQGSLSVSKHFIKIKDLWEELGEYKPIHTCNCDGVQPLVGFFQQEYIVTFLMGLNDSFALIYGQIMLMDPFPTIN